MAIREILEVPDPRLKQVSAPVTVFDDELKTLVADMFETTSTTAPGDSASPRSEVGVPLRVLVIDLHARTTRTTEPERLHRARRPSPHPPAGEEGAADLHQPGDP